MLSPTANPGSLFIVWTISLPCTKKKGFNILFDLRKCLVFWDTNKWVTKPGSAPPSWDRSVRLPPDLKRQSGTLWSRWGWPQHFLDIRRWCQQLCHCQNPSRISYPHRRLRRQAVKHIGFPFRPTRCKNNWHHFCCSAITHRWSPPAEGWGSVCSYQDQVAAGPGCRHYRHHHHTRLPYRPCRCPAGSCWWWLDSCPVSLGDRRHHWTREMFTGTNVLVCSTRT